MLWSTSPAGTEVEQALLDGLADALGPRRRRSPSRAAGAARSPTRRRRPRSSRCSRRCTAARQRIGHQPVAGRRASTAASASTSPPRPTPRWPRPCGSPGLGARALRVVDPAPGTLAMSPDALAAAAARGRRRRAAARAGLPDGRHHRHRRGRPGPRDRRGRPRARRVGARRRRLGRGRGALPGAPGAARRRRARRLVLHRRPQVAAHRVRRLAAVGARRARRCPPRCRSPRSTCATPRPSRARWSTTATGRSRWAAGSGR